MHDANNARAYGMRSIATDRDVIVRDPSGKGPMAYPTIARELRTILMGETPLKHTVVLPMAQPSIFRLHGSSPSLTCRICR